nr:M13 family metallopeptidase [Desulfuromonadales bacterium]
SAEGDYPPGSDEQKVGDLYTSYMDMETRNGLAASPLGKDFEQIRALAD